MKKADRIVLLQHESNWLIVYENSGFPSNNYCVFKANEWRSNEKLPSHGVAYCGSLEQALNCLFQQIIVENATKNSNYCGTLQDLRKAIDNAHKDFKALLWGSGSKKSSPSKSNISLRSENDK